MAALSNARRSRNLAAIWALIQGNTAAHIFLGDSLSKINVAGAGYKCRPVQLAQIGALGKLRAWQVGNIDGAAGANLSSMYLSTGSGMSSAYVDASAATSMTEAPETAERMGPPMNQPLRAKITGSYSPGGGLMASQYTEFNWLSAGVHKAWQAGDSDGIGVRPMFFAPGTGSMVNTAISLRDDGTVRATRNLSTDLLAVRNIAALPVTPGGGSIKSLPDVLLLNNGDSIATRRRLNYYVTNPVTNTGYLNFLEPLWYHATNSGGAPVWVPGNTLRVIAYDSRDPEDDVLNLAPNATYAKRFSDAQLLNWLDQGAIDAAVNTPVIWWHMDTRHRLTADPQGWGPLSTVAHWRRFVESFVARWDWACMQVYGRLPRYVFNPPAHHWWTGGGFGDPQSTDDATNAARHELLTLAIDQAGQDNARIGLASTFAWLRGRMPDGDDAELTAQLDAFFGSNWVPAGTSYAAYTPGTGGPAPGNLLEDGLKLHTRNDNASRAMSAMVLDMLQSDGAASMQSAASAKRFLKMGEL